jgi:hypothetical protein
MKALFLLVFSISAAPAYAGVKIQDLTIVAEKGVSAEEMKKALLVAASNINWPQSVTQGNAPNVYTNANNPYSVTAGSIPNGLTRGNFPDSYTIGQFGAGAGDDAIPMPNTNL